MPRAFLPLTPAAALLPALLALPLAATEVRFEINDAHVKGKSVPGAAILIAGAPGGEPLVTATSDESGLAMVDLEPGTWWVSYVRPGYVPIGDSETEIRGAGQVVTTTMSMLLEAESEAGGGGAVSRRVRIVLNWGSDPADVRDADAHVYCVCGRRDAHVYFAAMRHAAAGHVAELDVDDRDWGGPETVTLRDPPPGAYRYWVHQYSRDEDALGQSDVVVRVFFDDILAGEARIPADRRERTWRPFREIRVGADLRPELVRFSADELAAGADLEPPPDALSEQGAGDSGRDAAVGCFLALASVLVVLSLLALAVSRRRR